MAAPDGQDAPAELGTPEDGPTGIFKPRKFWHFEVLRVPKEIWPALKTHLERAKGDLPLVSWLPALRDSFPDRPLTEVVRGEHALFPSCLQDYLVMENNGELSVRDIWKKEEKEREASRVAELDAFRACPFRKGFKFASNGMLCDAPPIPIRTLDFLDAHDLLSLSRVCKATHQAAHFLFEREENVAAGLYDGWSLHQSKQAKGQQAKLLRGIRLGSMMHGTPKAIPIEKPVGWMKDAKRHDDALDLTYELLMEEGRSDVLEWHGLICDNLFDFTPPQVAELQKKLKDLRSPKDAGSTATGRQRTVDDISSLVDAAVARGDHVLFQHSGLAYLIGMTFVLNPVVAEE